MARSPRWECVHCSAPPTLIVVVGGVPAVVVVKAAGACGCGRAERCGFAELGFLQRCSTSSRSRMTSRLAFPFHAASASCLCANAAAGMNRPAPLRQ